MSRNAELRPRARLDLGEIWRYTADRWDRRQADLYVGRLIQTIDDLRSPGRRTRTRDAIHPGLRSVKTGSHLIFFLMSEDGVDVVRILHERMDLAARLAEELQRDN